MAGNGPGFDNPHDARMNHLGRFLARPTNLDYQFSARQAGMPQQAPREVLPPSPLDGEEAWKRALATEQAQTAAMERFAQQNGLQQEGPLVADPNMDVAQMAKAARQGAAQPAELPQQEAPQQLIPQSFGEMKKKSLKEIAWEKGQIPRGGK